MKYGRRRRRKSSYNRRKSGEVIVLSDNEESKNKVNKNINEQNDNVASQEEPKEEVELSETRTDGPGKDDPVHAPDDEESPVVMRDVTTEDAPTEATEITPAGQQDPDTMDSQSSLTRSDERIPEEQNVPQSVPQTETTAAMEDVSVDNYDGGIAETTNGQAGLNSRQTTFQKLRERIMMNKLQKSTSIENSNPIRPSLYRKYPKRKNSREKERFHEIVPVITPKDIQMKERVIQDEMKTTILAPVQDKVENNDGYQRYYLQPINPYGTMPIQIPIKEEPKDEIQMAEVTTKEEIKQISETDFVKNDGKNVEYKGAKRNLEPEFEDESNKKSTEEERIWLRALKEQGVKEVKRNENISGISQQYQNEYYKFIEGKDFSKEAKELHNMNSQGDMKFKAVEKVPGVKPDGQSVDVSATPKEAFELTDFCSSLMARHPLYLQPCEEQATPGSQGGQVMFVPYPQTPKLANTQGSCQCQSQQCLGKCKVSASPKFGTALGTPMAVPTFLAPSVVSDNSMEPQNLVQNIPMLVPINAQNKNPTSEERDDNATSHNSRRKQTAPKRRKPKEDEDDNTTASESKIQRQAENSGKTQESTVPQPPLVNAEQLTAVPGGPTATAPGEDVAYAYIAIPVSAFVQNQSVPGTPVPQPFVVPPQIPNPTANSVPFDQNPIQNQALDFSTRSKPEREPGEIEPIKSRGQHKGQGQRPVAPVQPFPVSSVPVNPFTRNSHRSSDVARGQHPIQLQQQEMSTRRNAQPNILQHSAYSVPMPVLSGDVNKGHIQRTLTSEGQGQLQGQEHLVQQRLQAAYKHRMQLQASALEESKKAKTKHSQLEDTAQFSHFACLQENNAHRVFEEFPKRSQNNGVPNAPDRNPEQFGDLRRAISQGSTTQNDKDKNQLSGNVLGQPSCVTMQIPVMNEHAQRPGQFPVPFHFGHYPGSLIPERHLEQAQREPISFSKSQSRIRTQSQFIDLTDDADDVEDVYSPGNDDVTMPENLSMTSQNMIQTQRQMLPSSDTQIIQEEQIRLMDNVSKLAELHSEVGALLNESTHILDTLTPNETENMDAKKAKRKKGKTGRKLIKYDAKGRRIFKFHEYCPR